MSRYDGGRLSSFAINVTNIAELQNESKRRFHDLVLCDYSQARLQLASDEADVN